MKSKCFDCSKKTVYEPLLDEFMCSEPECRKFSKFVPKGKRQTNADRIRAMSDEELAGFIDGFWSAAWCPDDPPVDANTKECLMHDGNCQLCILDWLRQEANDD